jgi:hypothetical protein
MLQPLIPAALALLHGGHGRQGDSPNLLLRVEHYAAEPRHLMPAIMGAALVVTLLAVRQQQDAPRR